MKIKKTFFKAALISSISILIVACGAPTTVKTAKKGQITPDSLYIVDCLLPQQIRQLGQNMTYLPPRNAVRLSAKDCALRGGEYVAYDGSNFSEVAKVWMPLAQDGDAKAQNYLGELYEKGMDGNPDYQSAAMWYQKATEQGYTPAMLNLGSLYEQGLGVTKDTTKAVNLYRMASGIKDAKLELVTEKNLRERRAKEHQRVKLLQEVNALRNQLSQVKKEYNLTKKYVEQSNKKLKNLQAQLENKKNDAKTINKIAQLKSEINKKNKELAKQNKVIDTLVTKVADKAIDKDLAQVSANAGIDIITPDVVLTRGIKTIPVQANARSLEVMGQVKPPEGVVALKINNTDIKSSMTDSGLFEGQINLSAGDTPVNVVAVRKDGSKNVQQFVVVRNQLEEIKARHFDELFTRRF
ncbi:MAG TPA: hypothetical protein ENJ44_01045, partial [Oceanospirillales bacterium]|nr:hypothetical protein [Oceanospirillales bacterium]